MALRLRAEGIGQHYQAGFIRRRRIPVLLEVTLELEEGVTVGLMGASGSGKTTLGRILAGLIRPSQGSVLLDGQDVWRMGRREHAGFRRAVQMVFQDPEASLNPRKTIGRSLYEVLDLQRIPKAEQRRQIHDILDTVGLSPEHLVRYPRQLSGGQNQRVALGRVLLLDPKMMILDEPTSALDISVQAYILHLLKRLQMERGLGYLIISHDPDVIRFMADRVVVMNEGRLIVSEEDHPLRGDFALTAPLRRPGRQQVGQIGRSSPKPRI